MIHYLLRLVKLFVVNLQSTVSGIKKKILNQKSSESHYINDLLVFRGAQLNATQVGGGSSRVGLPKTIETRGRVWSFPLASLLGIFLILSAFLPRSYQFWVSKAPTALSS